MEVHVRELATLGAAFGTSGVRGTVASLTDEVAYAYTSAFLQEVVARVEPAGVTVAIGFDLRPSSPRIATACAAACRAHGHPVVNCGPIPTPALAYHAIQERRPAVVITGSHIPFDRNGIKFYASRGEILKEDEAAITGATVDVPEGAFDGGMLRSAPPLPEVDARAREQYRRRYLDFFPPGFLRRKRIGVYQHSSVVRDLCTDLLRDLGADAIVLGRTDTFVPIDTEAVSEADQRQARTWAAEHRLDALVSTDGDADRPLVGDEAGTWLRGDVVGMLCAAYVGARTVVTPVSSNTAVDRWGRFERVVRTRIGSPYVIAAMTEALAGGSAPVVGYEANGGFLLGSDVTSPRGTRLAALPTRDALLPMLSMLALAAEKGSPLSRITEGLPARYTASDRLQQFAPERSRAILAHLRSSPEALRAFFAEVGEVAEVNEVDGVRVTFRTGDIVHLRPSGNAPELRCYAEADTPERARELCAWGLRAAAIAQP